MKRQRLTRDARRAARVAKFIYAEKPMVAELLAQGITDAVALARQARETLRYGRDWFYAQHKQPAYSKAGAEKFLLAVVALGKPEADNSAGPPETANAVHAEANNGAGVFTVESLPLNPNLVFARNGAGELKSVVVGRSENFIRGMKFPAIPHPSFSGFYLISGPLPRFKGRW